MTNDGPYLQRFEHVNHPYNRWIPADPIDLRVGAKKPKGFAKAQTIPNKVNLDPSKEIPIHGPRIKPALHLTKEERLRRRREQSREQLRNKRLQKRARQIFGEPPEETNSLGLSTQDPPEEIPEDPTPTNSPADLSLLDPLLFTALTETDIEDFKKVEAALFGTNQYDTSSEITPRQQYESLPFLPSYQYPNALYYQPPQAPNEGSSRDHQA